MPAPATRDSFSDESCPLCITFDERFLDPRQSGKASKNLLDYTHTCPFTATRCLSLCLFHHERKYAMPKRLILIPFIVSVSSRPCVSFVLSFSLLLLGVRGCRDGVMVGE